MENEFFKQMDFLANKYLNSGLSIDIEFDRYGLTLRGCWDLSLAYYEILHFSREYSWIMLKNLSNVLGLEYLIDEFKKEFEKLIERGEIK